MPDSVFDEDHPPPVGPETVAVNETGYIYHYPETDPYHEGAPLWDLVFPWDEAGNAKQACLDVATELRDFVSAREGLVTDHMDDWYGGDRDDYDEASEYENQRCRDDADGLDDVAEHIESIGQKTVDENATRTTNRGAYDEYMKNHGITPYGGAP